VDLVAVCVVFGRDAEIQILEKMKEFVLKNPTTPLLFSVTPGKNGYQFKVSRRKEY
jgi:hypothetical protein